MSTKKDVIEEMLRRVKAAEGGHCCESGHCWHAKHGAIWMVVKDGHVILECCRCPATRSVHADHAMDTCRENRESFRLWGNGALTGWSQDLGKMAVEAYEARDERERGRQATKFRC